MEKTERTPVWFVRSMMKNMNAVVPMNVRPVDAVKYCIMCTKELNEIRRIVRDSSLGTEDAFQQIVDIAMR